MSAADANVVLVTGGTGGIGTQICRRLVADGYAVVAADAGLPAEARALPLPEIAEGVTGCHVDIRDAGSVAACIEATVARGPLHGVVNCAGILRHGLLEDVTEEGMHTVWDVNLAGMIRVCRAAVPHMGPGGAIVNISSVTAGIGRLRGGGIYGASKAAMETFTRYLAHELAPGGIRVNALAPGFIEVLPMSPSMRFIASGETDAEAIAWLLSHIPMGRMGQAAEMAGPVAFLLSDDASYITGHVLAADGGVVAA